MKVELDGIQMDMAEGKAEGVSDGRSVSNISTSDKRNVESQDAPGGQGSSHNDLGRAAVVVSFEGTMFGGNAKAVLESIRSKFNKGDPVPFLSEISGAADITKVIIDKFTVSDAEGSKDRYDYSIVLKEYKEPPEEPTTPETGAEGEAKDWVEKEADKSKNILISYTGFVVDEDGNPIKIKGIRVKVKGDKGEQMVETNEKGEYVVDDLEPGEYTFSIEDDTYESKEETKTISNS